MLLCSTDMRIAPAFVVHQIIGDAGLFAGMNFSRAARERAPESS